MKRKIRRVIVTLIGMFSGKRMVDGRVVYGPSLNNLATETWQTNTSRDRVAMNHILSNVVHAVHLRRHGTQNNSFVISKVRNQSSVHVRRKHVGDYSTHGITAEVLEDANCVFNRLKKKWRCIILEINGDINKTDRAARVSKHRVNVGESPVSRLISSPGNRFCA